MKKNKPKIVKKKNTKLYDTIIIGAGIAGCTASIYASRKKMKFALLTEKFGGQFYEAGEVLNYPGIKQTTGADFSKLMEEQLTFNNVKPIIGTKVEQIKRKGKNFIIKTKKKEYFTQTVIITTGARPRELGVPGEQKFKQKGVTYCAICDGPMFAGQNIAVIGGGDAALEAVDFVKDIAKKIYLINLTDSFKAHEYLQDKVKKNKKVKILNNSKTVEILGDKFVKGLKYERNGKEKVLNITGIFVEIGRIPNTEFVKKLVKLDEHKHIDIDCHTQSSIPGIFAAGDCSSVHEYQFTIAAGHGCTALLKVARYLARKK